MRAAYLRLALLEEVVKSTGVVCARARTLLGVPLTESAVCLDQALLEEVDNVVSAPLVDADRFQLRAGVVLQLDDRRSPALVVDLELSELLRLVVDEPLHVRVRPQFSLADLQDGRRCLGSWRAVVYVLAAALHALVGEAIILGSKHLLQPRTLGADERLGEAELAAVLPPHHALREANEDQEEGEGKRRPHLHGRFQA
eukprot:CAMPEP_0206244326 /NCGR_PEP_ID=MMETSP0047_2-20121206/18098_1 /ASSEMBLY_ACC=CAM_ASM_000192 /TAXON_ID=195065 /ORGANISM="Chroomonas mesostigmatica_cf, Strain CCMP1168" /LENGTH=198 /DNA_ID=CAMNT_0053669539 /DNA_START=347 /DNA_END=944 /DNA_ORIENTATION=-